MKRTELKQIIKEAIQEIESVKIKKTNLNESDKYKEITNNGYWGITGFYSSKEKAEARGAAELANAKREPNIVKSYKYKVEKAGGSTWCLLGRTELTPEGQKELDDLFKD